MLLRIFLSIAQFQQQQQKQQLQQQCRTTTTFFLQSSKVKTIWPFVVLTAKKVSLAIGKETN